ncbi:MAG: protein kinase [Sandaracinus sp.]
MSGASEIPEIEGFKLHARVAAGGQGEVWYADDLGTGRAVAVKLLRAHLATSPAFHLRFQAEVQAIAQLSHPHVVRLVDYGITGPGPGGLRPYLVMEWARAALHERAPRSFAEARTALAAILSALAHAHARGILHCDVKPSNVLLVGGDHDDVAKLSDFGVARVRSGPTAAGQVWGTRAYAAPEAQLGLGELVGTWTDLYAVGITAYELVCGRAPFEGSAHDLVFMHAHAPLPPIVGARFAVPKGMDAWLARLCAKAPVDRFQRAHDALDSLHALGDAEPSTAPVAVDTAPVRADSRTLSLVLGRADGSPPPARGFLLADATLPERWPELGATPLPRYAPERASLLALRIMPVVGRAEPQRTLWELLREAASTRTGRLCLLRGPSGTGKSHLAQWLAERAHELGLANVLTARFSSGGDGTAGLSGMWTRYLGCEHVEPESLGLVVERALGGSEVPLVDRIALAGMLRGEAGSSAHDTLAERHALVARLLAACATRPLVIWLDDVQEDPHALELVETLVAHEMWRRTPLLVVATMRDDVLADDVRTTGASVRRWEAHATTLVLGALELPDMRALLGGPLQLLPSTASHLSERLAGNPLLAVQLVTSWAQRGMLVSTPDGLEVVGELLVPSELTTVWRERVESVLVSFGRSSFLALALAATLGLEVDAREHALACERLGAGPGGLGDDCLAELVRRRLVIPSARGWRFVHVLLRETLLVMGRESGVLVALHEAAEAALRAAHPATSPGIAARRARHLRTAGRLGEALELYSIAIEEAARREDPALVDALIAESERAGRDAAVDPEERRLREIVARATTHCYAGDYASAAALVAGLDEARCRPSTRIALLRIRGRLGWTASGDDAIGPVRRALALAREANDESEVARCLLELGHALQYQAHASAAERSYEEASMLFGRLGDAWGQARSLVGVAIARRKQGDLSSEPMLIEAARLFESIGNRRGFTMTQNERGGLAHASGRAAAAAAHFEAGLALATTPAERASLESNLGVLAIDEGDPARARPHLLRALGEAQTQQAWGLWSAIQVDLVECAAATRDFDEASTRLAAACAHLDKRTFAHPDIARRAELAARHAIDASEKGLARRALALALVQLEVLGDTREHARVRSLLDAIDAGERAP